MKERKKTTQHLPCFRPFFKPLNEALQMIFPLVCVLYRGLESVLYKLAHWN